MNDSLERIINRPDTWRGFNTSGRLAVLNHSANSAYYDVETLPTGFQTLDSRLQSGGWPLRGSVEVLSDSCGMGSMGVFLPAMERLTGQNRWQAFIAPPHTPYAPLLAARGIDTRQILMVHPQNREDLLWATEQAIRSTTCSVVFSWLGATDYRYAELRKLQLAAAANNTLVVLFRATAAAGQHTPSCLRLMISGYRQIDILKQRGGQHIENIRLEEDEDLPQQPQLWELPGTPGVQPRLPSLVPVAR